MVIAGLPTQAARTDEARGLIHWGFDAWDSQPLFARGQHRCRDTGAAGQRKPGCIAGTT